jgi:hypothetical protein
MAQKRIQIALACVFILLGFLLFCYQHPPTKQYFESFSAYQKRRILGTIRGELDDSGETTLFVKVQVGRQIFLEAYRSHPRDSVMEYLNKVVLPEKRDAYFHVNGQATNIALIDVNADGKLEILVPTLDESLFARLRVFEFDPTTGAFQSLPPNAVKL